MDHCFKARHLKFVQRLITIQAKLGKQRWSSVQEFCFCSGPTNMHLAMWPSGSNSPRTCIKLWLCAVRAVVKFAGRKMAPSSHSLCISTLLIGSSDHKRWPSGDQAYTVLHERGPMSFFTALGMHQQSSRDGIGA